LVFMLICAMQLCDFGLARKLSDITKTPSSMVGCSNCSAFNTLFAEHLTWHHDMELVLLLSGYNFL
jgi:hypothetical protein